MMWIKSFMLACGRGVGGWCLAAGHAFRADASVACAASSVFAKVANFLVSHVETRNFIDGIGQKADFPSVKCQWIHSAIVVFGAFPRFISCLCHCSHGRGRPGRGCCHQ